MICFVVRCLLFVVCCSLFVVCCLLFVVAERRALSAKRENRYLILFGSSFLILHFTLDILHWTFYFAKRGAQRAKRENHFFTSHCSRLKSVKPISACCRLPSAFILFVKFKKFCKVMVYLFHHLAIYFTQQSKGERLINCCNF